MYGSCPALLLEPQRTNLVLQSNTFNTSWSLFGGATITSNSTTSPDGSTNATTLNSAGGGNDFLFQSLTTTVGSTYTTTLYVKNINATQSRFWTAINASPTVDINWSGSTITSIGGTGGTYSFTSVGNGWYRVVAVFTSTISSYVFRIYSDTLNTSKSIYIYGAQCELGAYPTTYIPTTTASATRIADSFSRNNIYTNGLITSSGGTWFVELRGNLQYTRDAGNSNMFIGDAGNNSPSNSLEIRNGGIANSRLDLGKRISGTFTTLYSTTTSTTKIAFKWNGSSVDVFVNGTKQVSASSFSITNMEFLYSQIQDVPRFIQAMGLFTTPQTDQFCQDITTL